MRARRERGRRDGGASERRRVQACERRTHVRQRAHRARLLARAAHERAAAARVSPAEDEGGAHRGDGRGGVKGGGARATWPLAA